MNGPAPQAPGSSGWQLVFVSFAAILILFEIVRGWNRGVARQLARLAALIAAYFAAFFGGRILVPVTRPFFNVPDTVLSIAGGALLALIIYAVVNALGTAFFKRTRQYESVFARVLCGFGGALIGLFFGSFLVWVVVVGIRSLGSVANEEVRQQNANRDNLPQSRTMHAVDVRRRLAGEMPEESSSVMTSLARLKNSLELGRVGDLVKRSDIVPSKSYETLGKIAKVASDPAATERFLSYPGAQQLTSHPRITALRDDPAIAQMVEQGRFMDLLQNQRLVDALNDPTLVDELKKFDLQRALDYAIDGR